MKPPTSPMMLCSNMAVSIIVDQNKNNIKIQSDGKYRPKKHKKQVFHGNRHNRSKRDTGNDNGNEENPNFLAFSWICMLSCKVLCS